MRPEDWWEARHARLVKNEESFRQYNNRRMQQEPVDSDDDEERIPFLCECGDFTCVQALVMTVTGTAATQPGWIQAFPTDRPDVIAGTSTVNVVPGTSVANTAIIPIGANGVSVAGFFGTGSGHVVVDVVGYITGTKVRDQLTEEAAL
jgi:hypothetical protein